ncbi:efflux RND transporter periplasmic adaptor subunit [Flammeovirgaceae bacterium SG7u.111]|nr:efflux RND transporter periplasmic adaptor subunit [Flammeovirgaceae bacterium SG7u.132]WPO35839.1 efflux RND transporter periplasmic adaptor subunit [Flammeovirgaceae bacterium SG7u.111]
MINLKRIALLLVVFLAYSCAETEDDLSVAEKKQQLEQYKKEFATLKTKIDKLETEIKKVENVDPKAGLKRVETLTLSPHTFEHFIEVPGNVKSKQNVMVNPEMNGIILKKFVEEGQRVKRGDVLIEIDAVLIRKGIEEIETRLALAKTLFQRQENLWKQEIGSEVQFLQAKNEKEALERSLESQKEQLAKAFVRSPIDGVVDEFFVNRGEMASPSVSIARVVNLSVVEIDADVSESYIAHVNKGDSVVVNFKAIGKEIKLPIRYVGQFINPENRTFRIEMKANNKTGLLRPNTLAVVKINDFTKKGAITVPSNVIQRSTTGEKFLYIAQQEGDLEVVKKVFVEISKSYEGQTLVTKGLSTGDMVIVAGYSDVIDGEKVNVVNKLSMLTSK